MKIGVIVGRFQTDELTEGHKALLQTAFNETDIVVVLLGTPTFRTDRNPLSFSDRVHLVKDFALKPHVYPVLDNISDVVWSRNLDDFLNRTYPDSTFTLYHGRDSFASRYSGKIPLKEVVPSVMPTWHNLSASERRAAIAKSPVFTKDYRMGYIAAHEHMRPSVRVAVDVLYHEGPDFLLVRKPDEALWRFPGGMVDPGETAEFAARRELIEETGLEGGDWKLLGTLPVKDWRLRDSKHGVLSVIFLTKYIFGYAKAKDDVVEAKWFGSENLENILIPEHQEIWRSTCVQSAPLK